MRNGYSGWSQQARELFNGEHCGRKLGDQCGFQIRKLIPRGDCPQRFDFRMVQKTGPGGEMVGIELFGEQIDQPDSDHERSKDGRCLPRLVMIQRGGDERSRRVPEIEQTASEP